MFSEIRINSYLSSVLHQWSVNLAFGHQNKISEYNRNVLLLLRSHSKAKKYVCKRWNGNFLRDSMNCKVKNSIFISCLLPNQIVNGSLLCRESFKAIRVVFCPQKLLNKRFKPMIYVESLLFLSNVGLHVITFLLYFFHYSNVRAKRGYFIVWNPSK